jgi:flagellar biogenesis protein FliO
MDESAGVIAEPYVAAKALWRRARVLWGYVRRFGRRPPRRLRLCESLPLGERRFVAVIEFERSRFLVGGTSAALVLLAELGAKSDLGAGTGTAIDDGSSQGAGGLD